MLESFDQRRRLGRVLRWPPDVFALTATLLNWTETFRFVVSPPAGECWPPTADWNHDVSTAAAEWVAALDEPGRETPDLVRRCWDSLDAARETSLAALARREAWDLCCSLVTLHAVADEACACLPGETEVDRESFASRAWGRLLESGSLSRFPPWKIRVLPKTHLTNAGINLRSLSRHLASHVGPIHVSWTRIPLGDLDHRERDGTSYRLLLLPWPLEVEADDFRRCTGPLLNMPPPFGFFEYAPRQRFALSYAESALREALSRVPSVDGVLVPEAALLPEDIAPLEALLIDHGVYFLAAGVRKPVDGETMGENYAHVGLFDGADWHRVRANKHHRWSLDASQIRQYGLEDVLDPEGLWWEAISVPAREMEIVDVGDGATTSVLICEDLARLDVLAEILRYVGPTFVIALLMDGPQLPSRWSARYASVLADDPGSTVLTLTSLGMAQRARFGGHDPSRVVGLWKDPERGLAEIEVPEGANAVLLKVGEQRKAVWTADGRAHPAHTPRLVLDEVLPITAGAAVSSPPPRANVLATPVRGTGAT